MLRELDRRSFLIATGSALSGLASAPSWAADGPRKGRGLIVGHQESAEAGMAVLTEGGNAVDAVVAGALVAGVVAVSRCGIGGYGGHMTIGLPAGKVTCIDFNSEAPAAARPDMFARADKGSSNYNGNQIGWKAAGVPATMAGLQMALDKYGTKSFARLVEPAIRYARDGFAVYWSSPGSMARDPGSAKLFFRNGKPLKRGEKYRNPQLADLLQHLAEKRSANNFYHGEIAQQIAAAFRKNGGLVTAEDLENYRPLEIAPLQIDWRGHKIATAPITAGGATILQIIATCKELEDLWKRFPAGSAHRTQARLEAMRIAWGDRLRLFGDPRHVDVPIERLLSEKYARDSADKVREAIAKQRPVPVSSDGRTADGTLNLSAVDANGMMACLTMTHGDSFGEQVTVDGLGLLLGHGMSRFDPVPGRPNSIAPGKRPLDNMSPTIVLKGGKPVLAIGAVGGRRIVNAVFQVLTNLIAEGRSLEDAVADPHIHTEGDLNVWVEPGRPESEAKHLKQIGYTVRGPKMGWVSAVQMDPIANSRTIGIEDGLPRDGKGAGSAPSGKVHGLNNNVLVSIGFKPVSALKVAMINKHHNSKPRRDRRTFLSTAGGVIAGLATNRTLLAAASKKNDGIVIGNPEGSDAAQEIFAAGGNAVDAIVAAALVAGVAAVPMCGIGGYGGHMTVGLPNGKVASIDFNSVAPAAARPDMFPLDDKGQVKGDVHMTGWLAAGVPGTLAGLQLALDKFGTLRFARVVQPAIRIARNGFPVTLQFKHWLDLTAAPLARDPESARLLLPRGKPLARGETFRNPELADLLQQLAESGSVEPFYRGDIARRIAEQFKKHGGIVTEKDFAEYQAVEQTTLQRDFYGHTIATAPLSAGGLTVLQVCGTIEALDWPHLPNNGSTKAHAMLESLRIAWGDRLRLFGDPNFVNVPVKHLLSQEYARQSAQRVKEAVAEKRPVVVSTDGRPAGGTINLSAADATGTLAAMTLTHGDAFGARVTVPGMGLILGHGMSRFDPVPGKLNSIAPGKRPLDNMCPSIVLKDGRPVMALGGTGGRRIPNAIFQVLLHALAEGRSLEESVAAPRLHTEGGMEVRVERAWPQADVNFLKSIGYKFEPPMGSFFSAVKLDPGRDSRSRLLAVGDHQAEHSDPPGMRDDHPTVMRSDN